MMTATILPLHVSRDQAIAEACAWAERELDREWLIFLPAVLDRAERRCPTADSDDLWDAIRERLRPLGGQFDRPGPDRRPQANDKSGRPGTQF